MSLHIASEKEDIANIVIMPGDPKRASRFTEKYLNDYKLVSDVRGILAYTGYYKNKRVTIMASGMGNASMGIYSYELYNDYDVDYIIRVGTCGAYKKDIKLLSLLLVENSYSNTVYAKDLGYDFDTIKSSTKLNNIIVDTAKESNIKIDKCTIHNTDTFYNTVVDEEKIKNCTGVEMETFALFTNAYKFNKDASAIVTVSDNLVSNDRLSKDEREKSTSLMFELALNSILKL